MILKRLIIECNYFYKTVAKVESDGYLYYTIVSVYWQEKFSFCPNSKKPIIVSVANLPHYAFINISFDYATLNCSPPE